MSRPIDLSHPIANGMTTHPGIPAPTIRPLASRAEMASHYAPGVSFELTYVEMCTSIGTYVDSPAHRHAGLADLSRVPLDRYADLPGIVVDATAVAGRALGPEVFAGLDLAGRAVLVRGDWSRKWGTPDYWAPSPFLTAAASRALVDAGAALVGVDFGNVDDRDDGARPAHTILLAAGLGVVENLRALDELPTEGFRFHAVPLAVVGGMAWPVRAYAVVDPAS